MKHVFEDVGGYQFAWRLFDALPGVLLLLDDERRINALNEAAESFLAGAAETEQRFGEAAGCVNASVDPRGCGFAPACQSCQIRHASERAIAGERVQRHEVALTLTDGELGLVLSASPLEVQGHRLALMVVEDVTALERLRGRIPLCGGCGRLDPEPAAWAPLEALMKSGEPPAHRCANCRVA